MSNSLIPDWQVKRLAQAGMIDPFVDRKTSTGVVSYGLSSFGYDMRLESGVLLCTGSDDEYAVLDPKRSREDVFEWMDEHYEGGERWVEAPPHSFMLGRSVETWSIPNDVVAICLGKSTYARLGLIVNITPMEPGWKGVLTIEITNTSSCWVKIYVREGIAQALFFQGSVPDATYASGAARYQNQTSITHAKV